MCNSVQCLVFSNSRFLSCGGSEALLRARVPLRGERLFSYANINNIVSHRLFTDKSRAFLSPHPNFNFPFFSVVFVAVIVFTLPVCAPDTEMDRICHKANISS